MNGSGVPNKFLEAYSITSLSFAIDKEVDEFLFIINHSFTSGVGLQVIDVDG